MNNFKQLQVYQKSFVLAMQIFKISRDFPPEEKYALIDQVRRSSRSITACIAEAYRKRDYPNHFLSKMTDADMECAETQVWIDFAFTCKYLEEPEFNQLKSDCEEIGRLIGYMLRNHQKFL